MIRRTANSDHETLIALATASGLFEPEQTSMLADMLKEPSESDVWFTYVMHETAVGVAYLAPEKMTNGTWNLYWIAVHPDYQRKGIGKEILNYVERWLIERKERILLVETAGVDSFNYVRKFYADHGFESEAQIREFYDVGVDKIVFRKALTPAISREGGR